jgi:O-acetylhomoserine/O-acetylserine sulfhydrylase-like pyridoxal-dependent enzyme
VDRRPWYHCGACAARRGRHPLSLKQGGVVIDSGKFDWAASGRFPGFTESESYHGLNIAEAFGPVAFALKLRVEILRDIGAALNPFAAQQLLLGIETLSLRVERHVANTLALAQWLEQHDGIEWVSYPGLESHPSHALAKRLLPRGAGAVLSFGVKGDAKVGSTVVDSLKLASNLANVGVRALRSARTQQYLRIVQDAKTLVVRSPYSRPSEGSAHKHADPPGDNDASTALSRRAKVERRQARADPGVVRGSS